MSRDATELIKKIRGKTDTPGPVKGKRFGNVPESWDGSGHVPVVLDIARGTDAPIPSLNWIGLKPSPGDRVIVDTIEQNGEDIIAGVVHCPGDDEAAGGGGGGGGAVSNPTQVSVPWNPQVILSGGQASIIVDFPGLRAPAYLNATYSSTGAGAVIVWANVFADGQAVAFIENRGGDAWEAAEPYTLTVSKQQQ